jgi:hypothetical protein
MLGSLVQTRAAYEKLNELVCLEAKCAAHISICHTYTFIAV